MADAEASAFLPADRTRLATCAALASADWAVVLKVSREADGADVIRSGLPVDRARDPVAAVCADDAGFPVDRASVEVGDVDPSASFPADRTSDATRLVVARAIFPVESAREFVGVVVARQD